jgi:tRNA nucleotidyltransferase (CCA-adding enzyme)
MDSALKPSRHGLGRIKWEARGKPIYTSRNIVDDPVDPRRRVACAMILADDCYLTGTFG